MKKLTIIYGAPQ